VASDEDAKHEQTSPSFDQKLLLGRLFRSQGQKFQPGVIATNYSHAGASSTAHFSTGPNGSETNARQKTAPGADPSLGKDRLLISLESLHGPTPPPPAPVGVPKPLHPLLGSRLNLRTLSEAGQAAGPAALSEATSVSSEVKVDLSRTGKLPTSKEALEKITTELSGDSPTQSKYRLFSRAGRTYHLARNRPDSSAGGSSADGSSSRLGVPSRQGSDPNAETDGADVAPTLKGQKLDMLSTLSASANAMSIAHKKRLREYGLYLTSPFSFIDKILESPYSEEFVYLNPKGPYNLTIVKHNEINPNNYYTMSRAGVTHFYQRGTDFCTLEQWEREYFLYIKMMEIPFFRKFRAWKAFYFWKKLIRKQKIAKASKYLQENVAILNNCLRDSLMRLKSLCWEVSRWVLIRVDTKSTQSLDEFVQTQLRQQEQLADHLARFNHQVRMIVQTACDRDMRQFLVENGFRGSAATRDLESKDGHSMALGELDSISQVSTGFGSLANSSGFGTMGGGTSQVGGALIAAGGDDFSRITRAEKAAQRTKYKKLGKFIRLADFHIIHTMVALCLDRSNDLLRILDRKPPASIPSADIRADLDPNDPLTASMLHGPPAHGGANHGRQPYGYAAVAAAVAAARKRRNAEKQETGLFRVELLYVESTGELTFSPTLDDFLNAIDYHLHQAITTVMNQPRMVYDEQFKDYAAGMRSEAGDADAQESNALSLVLENPLFEEVKERLNSVFIHAFKVAGQYAMGFADAAAKHRENMTMNVDALRSSPPHVLADLIAKFEKQAQDFEHLRISTDLGILHVDTSRLKKTFEPSPRARRQEVCRMLPEIFRQNCEALLADTNERHAQITKPTTNVDEYVEVLRHMRDIAKTQEETDERFRFINELQSLMSDNQIRLGEAERSAWDRLQVMRQNFKSAFQATDLKLQASSEQYSEELNKQKVQFEHELGAIHLSASDPTVSVYDPTRIGDVIQLLQRADFKLSEVETKIKTFHEYQDTLGLEIHQFEKLREVRTDVNIKLDLWRALEDWDSFKASYTTIKFPDLDIAELTKSLSRYQKICSRARRHMQDCPPVEQLREKVGELAAMIPIVSDLRNPALLNRHWEELIKILGLPMPAMPNTPHHMLQQGGAPPSLSQLIQADLTIQILLDRGAIEHAEAISNVAVKARNEAILQAQITRVQSMWNDLKFPLVPYKGQKGLEILADVTDIRVALDDALITVSSVLGSHFSTNIRAEAQNLDQRLRHFEATLEVWVVCQRKWMYLEPIFSSPDIARNLPEDYLLFEEAHKMYVQVMNRTSDHPEVRAVDTYTNLKEILEDCLERLERVAKRLEEYLRAKRNYFSRFYFIADDELIKILSLQKNFESIQDYLNKMFDNIVRVQLNEAGQISTLVSREGEHVHVLTPVKVRSVENWLSDLRSEMVKTLRRIIVAAIKSHPREDRPERRGWIMQHPAQAIMTAVQVHWSFETEVALRNRNNERKSLEDWYKRQVRNLLELTSIVRSNLSPLDRAKIVALITTDLHARDITKQLIDNGVKNEHDFQWQQQLRFYLDDESVKINQANATMKYGYEYVGVSSRLVITPLTDRCWLTVTSALHLSYGVSPAGPAGTGKTESVKDLAKTLGIFCIVTNCNERMTAKLTQSLFVGGIVSGAWLCMDEFNRIDIEVLSVIAQQLLQIRKALLAQETTFVFQDVALEMNQDSQYGVMVTMNPDYAGRTELPDNLKVLFRPVSMMVPDYRMIAENLLFSNGFENATSLSLKMTQLYKLASEQLSQQDHYDFGMRALKSVLTMAGSLKRAEPHADESALLIRAMRDSNVPKFISSDLPLFNAIVQDLFPDNKLPEVDNSILEGSIAKVLESSNLQKVPKFILKVVQLHDTFNVRFGAMVVGPTGGGKTTCWRTLASALSRLNRERPKDDRFHQVHTFALNPKSVAGQELFGYTNDLTGQWNNGLASQLIIDAMSKKDNDKRWIVFDGPVDALWIEDLNTVLDDSMTLTLANNSRIKLSHQLRILFEVQDLSKASPATVSRCGMVYITPEDMGVLPYVRTWISRLDYLSPQVKTYIMSLFEEKIDMLLEIVNAMKDREYIPVTDLNRVATVCRFMEVFLHPLARARQVFEQAEFTRQCDAMARAAAQTVSTSGEESKAGAATTAATPAAAPGAESRGMAEDDADDEDDEAGDEESGELHGSGDGEFDLDTRRGTAAANASLAPVWGQELDHMRLIIDMVFAFAVAWGIGGALNEEAQAAFSKRLSDIFLHVKPPGSFYDAVIDLNDRSWRHWDADLLPFYYNANVPYFQILVPTVDTVRFRSLAQLLLAHGDPVFFTGVTGVGKTVILQDMFAKYADFAGYIRSNYEDESLRHLHGVIQIGHGRHALEGTGTARTFTAEDREYIASSLDFQPLSIAFSAQSSCGKTLKSIKQRVIKLSPSSLGAAQNKRLIIYVDDVNMPALDKYGAQPPVELLRQIVDYRGFYDHEETFVWKTLHNFSVLCSAAPPGGGRSPTTPCFVRHFSMFSLPTPSEAAMKRIFSSIYSGWIQQGFKQSLSRMCEPIVASTIELYLTISKEMLPTPAKSHYTFNLRDVSKVFQGILNVKPISCTSPEAMVRLWVHEVQRCFEDRLVDDTDKRWCAQKIMYMLQRNFGPEGRQDALQLVPPSGPAAQSTSSPASRLGVMFTDLLNDDDRLYEEVTDAGRFISTLENRLIDFNAGGSRNNAYKLDLVFFDDAVKHIARITRIIRQPRGNAMLVGVGGSGKQSLCRLAAFLADYECRQPEVSANYTYANFQEFLKEVLRAAGGRDAKSVVLMLTESHIVDERFLEDINNLLNSGEVPDLLQKDDIQAIVDDLTPYASEKGLSTTRSAVYELFVQRVRDNLHIVLCLSPVGDSFRRRCRMFPSLINCCTIDWFTVWPKEALLSVARVILRDKMLKLDPAIAEALATESMEVHRAVEAAADRFMKEQRRHVYTTPKSFIDMLNLFKSMFARLYTRLESRYERFETGLGRLRDTKDMVRELQTAIEKLKPDLEAKLIAADEGAKAVEIEKRKAIEVEAAVAKEEQEVSQKTAETTAEQQAAKVVADTVAAVVQQTRAQLASLKPADISDMRRTAHSHEELRLVVEAVGILVARPNEDQKTVMNSPNLIFRMMEVTPNAQQIRKVDEIVRQLEGRPLRNISTTCELIFNWLKCNQRLYDAMREYEPKRLRAEMLLRQKEEAEKELRIKREKLEAVQKYVREMEAEAARLVAERDELQRRTDEARARLSRATKLMDLLADESERWREDADKLKAQLNVLVGDAFVASACVSYAGPFTGDYRSALIAQWLANLRLAEVPVSANFSLQNVLGDPVAIRQWCIDGLPSDDVSIESAIYAMEARRWPLLIDPQGQAKKWLKGSRGGRNTGQVQATGSVPSMTQRSGAAGGVTQALAAAQAQGQLLVTRMNDPALTKILEMAITMGHALLIEDINETIDNVLDPVLQRQVFVEAGRQVIRLGANSCPTYNDNFRLFMTTKLANPHYLPEVFIKVTVINATVTRQCLEDQLLMEVVRHESPEIEETKNNLVITMANEKAQLAKIEETILQSLGTSKRGVLDDDSLINTLTQAKNTKKQLDTALTRSAQTQQEIEAVRSQYRPVATRGSLIYFVIADLALIDPMYQYSLDYFVKFFNQCIIKAPPSPEVPRRVQNLLDTIVEGFFNNVCRGLFEAHKAIFAFMLVMQIMRYTGDVSPAAWNTFVRGCGTTVTGLADPLPVCPFPDEISPETWLELNKLELVLPEYFSGLISSMRNPDLHRKWQQWLQSSEVSELPLPSPFEELSPFARLLFIKITRFPHLQMASRVFVASHEVGRLIATPKPTSLVDVYNDSDASTPIIFVLSSGADPSELLFRFARDRGMEHKLLTLSLGQGQGERAQTLIREALKNGNWVLLQNCHLASSWMPQLEAIVETFDHDDHPDFRLWLTSMPSPTFPVSVLQRGLKITNEPPRGIKANLTRSYTNVIREEELEKHARPHIWKKLAFGLAFFHATIQERRKFGPLGWNKRYDWNDSDLVTSVKIVSDMLTQHEHVPWDALTYLCGEICYGGRVTDSWDRRCLMVILSKFFTPSIEKDDYRFSDSGKYYAPPIGPWKSYLNYISVLPETEEPEVFGMNQNAHINFLTQESDAMFKTIVSLQPRNIESGGSGGAAIKSADDMVLEVAATIESKLPALLDIASEAGPNTLPVDEDAPGDGEEVKVDSLNEFLKQEIDRYNSLLVTMRVSLTELQRAIKGLVVMSEDLDLMYDSLLNNKLPKLWADKAPPTLMNLSTWTANLNDRVAFIRSWLRNGKPMSYWLPGFFFVHGFLTAVLQTHARRYHIPIDSISFSFEVQSNTSDPSELTAPAEDGVYVHGLYTTGAKWDVESDCIVDSDVGELVSELPVIHFLPKENYTMNESDYACPVYQTSIRQGVLSTTGQSTNFVLEIHLPSKQKASYWILNGVAILCQPTL